MQSGLQLFVLQICDMRNKIGLKRIAVGATELLQNGLQLKFRGVISKRDLIRFTVRIPYDTASLLMGLRRWCLFQRSLFSEDFSTTGLVSSTWNKRSLGFSK